jgi:hypothetical protein
LRFDPFARVLPVNSTRYGPPPRTELHELEHVDLEVLPRLDPAPERVLAGLEARHLLEDVLLERRLTLRWVSSASICCRW